MKNMNKKRIIIGVAVLVLAIVIYGVGRSLASPNSQSKPVKVDGLSFENASVTYKKKMSTFTVDVYNENKSTYRLSNINIKLENKKGNNIVLTYDIESLESDEGRKIIIENIDYDLRDYNKISYTITK